MKNLKPAIEEVLWMYQLAGYMKAVTHKFGEPCTEAVMHPVYPMGNRKGGINTIYAPQLVTFEEEEINAAWKEIMKYKDQAVAEENA